MSDNRYQTFSYRFQNGGLQARYVYDKPPAGSYRNLENLESRVENTLATRYGWQGLTQDGTSNLPLGSPVVSLGKMQSLNNVFYRYAVSGSTLFRSPAATNFGAIATGLSGSRASMAPYRPAANSNPWMFIADKSVLLKDSGTGQANAWGIAPPTQPPHVQIGDPAKTVIEPFTSIPISGLPLFTFVNYTGVTPAFRARGQFQATGNQLGVVTFIEPPVGGGTISRTANVATVTLGSSPGWVSGMRINATVPNDVTFNAASVVITVTGPNTFTYPSTGANVGTTAEPGATYSSLPSFSPYMFVTIDAGLTAETVMVLEIIPGVGFTANQTKPHTTSFLYQAFNFQGNVAANTTATISRPGAFNFAGTSAAPNGTPYSIATAVRFSGVVTLDLGPLAPPPDWRVGNTINVASVSDPSFNATSVPIIGVSIVGGDFQVQYPQTAPNASASGGSVTKLSGNSTVAEDDDFFSLFVQASDPFAISEIRVIFDVGDGSFSQDYFYKSITPDTSQPAVSASLTNGAVLTKQVFDRASGLTDNRRLGVTATDLLPSDLDSLRWLRPGNLNTGKTAWSSVQMMRGEFVAVGAAGSPTNGWDKVVAWRISIRTQPNSTATVSLADLVFIGGSQVDSFNANPYDYRVTLYNINTGDESNPSITLNDSLFVTPRRQPVLVELNQISEIFSGLAGAGTNGGGVNQPWTNPGNIASGSVYASVTEFPDGTSQQLLAKNFGFAIPPGPAVPSTITVSFQYFWTGSAAPFSGTVQLLKGGVPVGVAQILTFQFAGGSSGSPLFAELVFSPSGLSVADINASNFGFQISIFNATTAPIHFNIRAGAIVVSLGAPIDSQVTHWRVYRRGGTLTQAWYRVNQIPINTPFYEDTVDDATIELNDQLQIDNDPPITSLMQQPLNQAIASVVQPSIPGPAVITFAQPVSNAFIGQFVTVGSGDSEEEGYVSDTTIVAGLVTAITVWMQQAHTIGEIVSATNQPQMPMNLMAIAFDQAWLAGDVNNPHVLYYSKVFQPEVFPQKNFLEVGTPDAPIMALIAHRGLLYVLTTKTIYQVLGAGSGVPTVIPTGVKHGLTGNFAWATAESIIFYESYDGVYAFTGASSSYMTEQVEWIFISKNLGPVQAEGAGQKPNTVMAYANHELFVSYVDGSGRRRRMIFNDVYRRWRNDDSNQADITGMNFEEDTGTLIIGGLDGMVYQDRVNDYDWGVLAAGVLTKTPIAFTLQTSQMDQDVPKSFKVYNELTLDMDTNGQTVAISLIFDNGATIMPLGTFTGTGRKQYQININAGDGYRSQNVGVLITGSVTAAVAFFEVHIRALVESEFRRSFDSYWVKYGSDEWKIVKQGWFEYSAPDPAGISFLCFVEGNMTAPIFSFTLPQSIARKTERIRFPATKATMFRWVATSASDFQLYDESMIEMKSLAAQKGYARQKLST